MNKDRFFDRLDWAAFWTATLAAFAVYAFTLGPSVGLEDSGELATAADHLGVPHSPGYPFWTLCSWLFCRLFFWVTYMGHPTPAWSVSLCSAVFGAFAAGCTAMLICRSSRDFTTGDGGTGADGAPSGTGPVLAFAGGVAGALTFALSPVEWSQSTIVEIYSLNALFLMWVFLLSYRWMRRPSDRILWTAAFVFGLGLTNYQVLLFAIVPLAIIMLFRNTSMFRDVFIYLVPVAMCCQVLKVGSLDQASWAMQRDVIAKHMPLASTAGCPSTPLLAAGVAAVAVSLAAAAVLRSRGDGERSRRAAVWGGFGGVASMLLSCTLFAGTNEWSGIFTPVAPLVEPSRYAFIAAFAAASAVASAVAALQDGERRLSDPRCLRWLAASAACGLAAVCVAASVPQADLYGYTGPAYPWTKTTLVFAALLAALFALCRFTPRGLCFAIPVAALQIAVFILLRRGAMNGLVHPQSWWFCWPIAWNFVLLALAWVTLPNGRSVAGAAFFAQLGVSFYAYMPLVSDLRNPPMNWAYPRTWEGFKHAIMREQYAKIEFPDFSSVGEFLGFLWQKMSWYFRDVRVQFTDILIPFAFAPAVFGGHVVAKERRRGFWQWMGAAAACFLVMSVLLILLADVKGTVSDGFIQKVKFISSHAMIALWIGYGLFFAGVVAARLALRAGSRAAKAAAWTFSAAAVLAAFASPVVANRTDARMVFELGGCEQSGHTFGWQFGAYGLDGAKAIREQLVADEEPLPDPDWPEPMEPFSVFFGGTDPGRFVPTYMIYSADYRPDIYLITQNALADDKYMSVERDLYGDEIWIPSSKDASAAFETYVEEIDRGRRPPPPPGNLIRQNGRVQVVGTESVMEINAILARMMFEHERGRRGFYLEESYPMKWMYDYLSPHGMIMKIEKDPWTFDRRLAEKDRDFWDWYVRRLLADPNFRRDFAAQKAMGKLRQAIGGLWDAKGGEARPLARQALREAFVLCRLPDAGLPFARNAAADGRWNVAFDGLAALGEKDPNNSGLTYEAYRLSRQKALVDSAMRCETAKARGVSGRNVDMELASCYRQLGRYAEAAALVKPYADAAGRPDEILAIAQTLALGGDIETAARTLERYVRAVPGAEPGLWVLAARYQLRAGRRLAAAQCISDAPDAAKRLMEDGINRDGDRELRDIYEVFVNRKRRR